MLGECRIFSRICITDTSCSLFFYLNCPSRIGIPVFELKFEARSTKSETISNAQNTNFQNKNVDLATIVDPLPRKQKSLIVQSDSCRVIEVVLRKLCSVTV